MKTWKHRFRDELMSIRGAITARRADLNTLEEKLEEAEHHYWLESKKDRLDCRTCKHYDSHNVKCQSFMHCVNGDEYEAGEPVILWTFELPFTPSPKAE